MPADSMMTRVFRALSVLTAVTCATGLGPEPMRAAASSPNPELAAAVDLLRARNNEFRREDAAYRASLSGAGLSASERADYAGFVATLKLKLLQQCEVVRGLGGERALEGTDCIRLAPAQSVVVLPPASQVQTDDEKRAAIQARLNKLEGDIDEDLQKRQQEIRQASAQPSGGAAAGGASGAAAGGAAGSGAAQAAAGQSAAGGRAGTSQATGAGQSGSTGTAVPGQQQAGRGTPGNRQHDRQAAGDGGAGDDVVARQLREAAEKETDPVLKEKLWAEYRRYQEAKK